MTKDELNKLKNIDIRTVDIDTLVDIRDVKIDRDLPLEKRQKQYLEQVKNPFMLRYGKYKIKLTHSENSGLTLQDCFETYLGVVGRIYTNTEARE